MTTTTLTKGAFMTTTTLTKTAAGVLLATGTGTQGSPATMSFEGNVYGSEITDARA